MNELDVEWVGETDWEYRTTFDSPSTDSASVYLIFDGLDTFAEVKLNNTVILKSDNMFLSHRIDITGHLNKTGSNVLLINFESALLKGRELQKEYPNHRWELFNGEAGRLTVRKAQYHWVSARPRMQYVWVMLTDVKGWDWGPLLNTAGPWRPVRLEVSSAHISDMIVKYELSPDLKKTEGVVELSVVGEFDEASLLIHCQDTNVYTSTTKGSCGNGLAISFSIGM